MDKIRELLARLLMYVADRLQRLAAIIDSPEFNVFEINESFNTFKEGMASSDYRVRHIAATKLVGWYLLGNGQPVVEDLTMAAKILLEEFVTTDGDVSILVGYWMAQASATNQDVRAKAEIDEQVFYDRLQPKDHSTTTK